MQNIVCWVVALALVPCGSALRLQDVRGDVGTTSDFSFDASVLQNLAAQHKASYAAAKPFPHIVLDGIIPHDFAQAVSNEIPEGKPDAHGCFPWATFCFAHDLHQKQKNSQDKHSFMKCDLYDKSSFMDPHREHGKNTIQNFKDMGPDTRTLTKALHSDAWMNFLVELTGIEDLLADEKNSGGGVHAISEGGFLHVHSDFNQQPHTNFRRRVNLLFFINEDWKDEYGGHLELWNRNVTTCEQRILPSFNRAVIFTTTDFSYHGHPHPLTAPEGRVRRSIAQYYYNKVHPPADCIDMNCNKSHSTLWQDPPDTCSAQ